jgi:hypothetical protein
VPARLLNDLRVIELPMNYEERIGTSKLSVVRDGNAVLPCHFFRRAVLQAGEVFSHWHRRVRVDNPSGWPRTR